MTLQDRLVELVAARGADIVDDPAEFHDGPNEDEPDEQDFSAEIDLRHVDDEWLVSRADMSYDDE